MLKKYIVCVLSLCILNLTAGGGSSIENKKSTRSNIPQLPSKEILDDRLKNTLFQRLASETKLTSELAHRRLVPVVIMSTIARNYDRYFTQNNIQQKDQDTMYDNTNDLLEILLEEHPNAFQRFKQFQDHTST